MRDSKKSIKNVFKKLNEAKKIAISKNEFFGRRNLIEKLNKLSEAVRTTYDGNLIIKIPGTPFEKGTLLGYSLNISDGSIQKCVISAWDERFSAIEKNLTLEIEVGNIAKVLDSVKDFLKSFGFVSQSIGGKTVFTCNAYESFISNSTHHCVLEGANKKRIEFVKGKGITTDLSKVVKTLRSLGYAKELAETLTALILDGTYEDVAKGVEDKESPESRKKILKDLCDNFFRVAPNTVPNDEFDLIYNAWKTNFETLINKGRKNLLKKLKDSLGIDADNWDAWSASIVGRSVVGLIDDADGKIDKADFYLINPKEAETPQAIAKSIRDAKKTNSENFKAFANSLLSKKAIGVSLKKVEKDFTVDVSTNISNAISFTGEFIIEPAYTKTKDGASSVYIEFEKSDGGAETLVFRTSGGKKEGSGKEKEFSTEWRTSTSPGTPHAIKSTNLGRAGTALKTELGLGSLKRKAIDELKGNPSALDTAKAGAYLIITKLGGEVDGKALDLSTVLELGEKEKLVGKISGEKSGIDKLHNVFEKSTGLTVAGGTNNYPTFILVH